MEAINFEQLLLKTAFCCMAADGNIDKREVSTIETLCEKSELFNDFNFQEAINHLVNEINTNGKQFIQDYFDLLSHSKLSEQEELSLIEFALKTIYADEEVEYSEVKFFKNIRHRLSLSDERIIETFKSEHSEIEDFLEEDIKTDNFLDKITNEFFAISELPKFENIIIENDN
ncbi:MAG: TerB family tellurite resistance protein [Bacteroidetes bacterium]|nr:TerB family tellurite resistance protein [Bacteroidota bacterium]